MPRARPSDDLGLRLRRLRSADGPVVATWFDGRTAAWLGGEGEVWVRRVLCGCTNNPRTDRAFALCEHGELRGAIWLHGYGGRRYFERVVAPAHRSRGFGRALLVLAARHPDFAHVHRFSGDVHVGNVACRASLAALGFRAGEDALEPDGYEHLTVYARRADIASVPVRR